MFGSVILDTLIGLLCIGALLLEGVLLLRQGKMPNKREFMQFGIITIVIAVIILVALCLFASGSAMVAPEFGLLMVQGNIAYIALFILIIAVSVTIGAVCYILHQCRNLWLLLLPAFVIGVAIASSIQALNSPTYTSLRVHSFDLWSPFLPILLVICWLEFGFWHFQLNVLRHKIWVIALLISVLSSIAILQPSSTDYFGYILGNNVIHLEMRILWDLILFIAAIIFVLFFSRSIYTAIKSRQKWTLPQASLRQIASFCLWLLLAMSLASTFLFGVLISINPTLVLALFSIAAISLLELSEYGMYQKLYQGSNTHFSTLNLIDLAQKIYPQFLKFLRSVWKKTQEIFSVTSMPMALFKTLIGLVIFIALSEFLNTGKTIIEPFNAADNLGQTISDRLVSDLNVFSQQLQPYFIIPVFTTEGNPMLPDGKTVNTAQVEFVKANNTDSLDTIKSGAQSFDIGNIHIPLGLFVTPIQNPIRAIMGVQMVEGSLQSDSEGISLLAHSSVGDSWIVKVQPSDTVSPTTPNFTASDQVPTLTKMLALQMLYRNPAAAAPGLTDFWEAFSSFQSGVQHLQHFEAEHNDEDLVSAIDHLQKAANKDKTFALAHYYLGLALQRDLQLGRAIESFRSSLIAKDDFAAAQNALAYSLISTTDSYTYRTHIVPNNPHQTNPSFDEAHDLWQRVLSMQSQTVTTLDRASAYYGLCLLESYQQPDSTSDLESQLSIVEKYEYYKRYALAYFHCKQAETAYITLPSKIRTTSRFRRAEASVSNQLGNLMERVHPYAEYAEHIEIALGSTFWDCDPNREANRIILNSLRKARHDKEIKPYLISVPYQKAAYTYFTRAAVLEPSNPILQCNWASAAFALGEVGPMQNLYSFSLASHLNIADSLANTTNQYIASSYGTDMYQAALDEYSSASHRSPRHLLAAFGYAYTTWQWYLRSSMDERVTKPTAGNLASAINFAEQASEIAHEKQFKIDEARSQIVLVGLQIASGITETTKITQQLETAHQALPKHVRYDDIRWDLAQVFWCAGEKHTAETVLAEIREIENGLEFQPFLNVAADTTMLAKSCLPS